jgi:hypothetical protein
MAENPNTTVTAILERLAQQKGNLPALSIDGQTVESETIAAALKLAADRMKTPVTTTRQLLGSIFRWLLYSVGLTLFLTVVFKALGMVFAKEYAQLAHLSVEQDVNRHTVVRELLLRGDLLLIAVGFAAEAIGDLLASRSRTLEPRWAVGFSCLVGLISSMLLVACSAALPSTAKPVEAFATIENIVFYGSPAVFGITMLAVFISKFIVGDTND